jgi:flagellar biosynthetic protein FliR
MLVQLMRFVPEHYVRMSGRVLEMLQTQMRGLPHG